MLRIALLAAVIAALISSAVAPYDRAVWLAEVMPVFIALPLLLASARRFPLTSLCYIMIAVFALILILGGAHTYARVPLGFALQEWLDLARNPYDRIGHFFQGATPAIVARELLLRTSPLRPGKWLFVVVSLSCLGISAGYELIEWLTAVLWADGSVAFLGTQGDVWDAQWDMLLALCGAVAAQLLFARLHDRQIGRMAQTQAGGGVPRA